MPFRPQDLRLALAFAAAGALSFWLPDVAAHVIARGNFDSIHVRLITFASPAALVIAYLAARRFAAELDVVLAMLSGVWLTGGLFMALSASASGGGFAGPDGFRGGLLMVALGAIPPVTFMMSVYDGSGLALLAATLCPLLVWCIRASGVISLFQRHASK